MNFTKSKKFNIAFFTTFFILLAPCYTDAAVTEKYVIPCGEAAGVKIYTEGLLVVGTSDVTDENGKKQNICDKYNIQINDIIKSANNTPLDTTQQLSEAVNSNPDGLDLTIERDGNNTDIHVLPVKSEDGTYKLGAWVRDSTAGIGTITYIDPENNSFAALGHGICDVDTGSILTIKSGNILNCSVLSVVKGEKGNPGELNGSFDGNPIGEIKQNTENGIYGKINTKEFTVDSKAIAVASQFQVKKGDAYILSDVDGSGVKPYSIEIIKVCENSSKGIVFEITDENLIGCTGGIIQGMSGAPIIQDNMLAGAVTHVMVNNPQKGYGTFAEGMIDVSDKI